MLRTLKSARTEVLALITGLLLAPAAWAVELTMYYPNFDGLGVARLVNQ